MINGVTCTWIFRQVYWKIDPSIFGNLYVQMKGNEGYFWFKCRVAVASFVNKIYSSFAAGKLENNLSDIPLPPFFVLWSIEICGHS